jgi:hypothetical protein
MAKTLALIFGIVYVLIGILGFFPAVGGTFSQTPSTLFGYVQTNLVHNIVHLIIGFAGLGAAGDDERAVMFCRWFGVILIVLGLLGYVIPNGFNIVPLGGYDIYIHLASGIILAIGGFTGSRAAARPA